MAAPDERKQQTSRFEVYRSEPGAPREEGEDTSVTPKRRRSDAGPEANLILIAHPQSQMLGTRFRFRPGSAVVIGRVKSADISLPDVSSVSRRHARLRYRTESVVLEDLGSTNGTYVNDTRIEDPAVLRSGDRFQVGGVHFKFLQERDVENAYHEAMHDLVVRDGLTQISNRRHFEEEADRELARARRYERPLTLVVFDLDNFKLINDTHGHLCGDLVLKQVVRLTTDFLRREQVFARIGGEEFAILTPEARGAGGRVLAERLRGRIARNPFEYAGESFPVTCSYGVAELDAEMKSARELYEAADQGLYRAKKSGRNTVAVFSREPA
ncbi:MAG TPA: GGDEF domain-containing protein [Thermoanaerobaculia bacterium]|nr:GGDEF domain-containing protein [Thermoanaerobaculia bacterium]